MLRIFLLAATFCAVTQCLGQAVDLVQVTEGKGDYRHPAWSPQEGFLAFESTRDGNWELYLLNLNDRSFARLTNDPADDRYPAWDPNGVRIVFQSNRTGKPELHVLNLRTQETSLLANIDGEERYPDWSSDGRTIAFSMVMDSVSQIVVLDASGGSAIIADSPFDSIWPRWSPDNNRLAFSSRRDTHGKDDELYVINRADTTIRRLTTRLGDDLYPTWSPSGDRIAVVGIEPDGTRTLRLVPLDGGPQQVLRTPFYRLADPAWSPDGKSIAVAARRKKGDSYQIFAVPVGE